MLDIRPIFQVFSYEAALKWEFGKVLMRKMVWTIRMKCVLRVLVFFSSQDLEYAEDSGAVRVCSGQSFGSSAL